MTARIRAPANLRDLVKTSFAKARESGDVLYFPTQVTILPINTIPFQLRFSPSLASKPKGPPKVDKERPFDPFANPPRELYISPLGPSHFLVLNKFAVVPEHFILATNQLKLQSLILEPSDLEATLACIDAYEQHHENNDEHGLFAFFNGGVHSGASQPHRHIQLLPITRMKDGLDPSSPWTVLASDLNALAKTPFMVFAEHLTRDASSFSPAQLHETYLRLYRQACRAVALHTGDHSKLHGDTHLNTDISTQEARISYNLALTNSTMVLCPRLADGANVLSSPDGNTVGSVSLNGTLLAGTALVKNELEWDALRRNHPEGFLDILRAIGVPRGDFQESSLKL